MRYRWCFDVHIKGLVRRSRVLEGARVQAFPDAVPAALLRAAADGLYRVRGAVARGAPRSAFCLFLNDARTSYDVGAGRARET